MTLGTTISILYCDCDSVNVSFMLLLTYGLHRDGVRFSEQFCCGFETSSTWHCVIASVFLQVSKDCSSFILLDYFTLKMKRLGSFETSRTSSQRLSVTCQTTLIFYGCTNDWRISSPCSSGCDTATLRELFPTFRKKHIAFIINDTVEKNNGC